MKKENDLKGYRGISVHATESDCDTMTVHLQGYNPFTGMPTYFSVAHYQESPRNREEEELFLSRLSDVLNAPIIRGHQGNF